MKSFSKRFEVLDATNQLEALKLMYVSASTKDDVFLIFKTFLHVIPEMPEVLTHCDDVMRTVRRQQSEEQEWRIMAERMRQNRRGVLEIEIAEMQKILATTRFGAQSTRRCARWDGKSSALSCGDEQAGRIAAFSGQDFYGYRRRKHEAY